jgi:tetratricopeptide (TPR) repeat protein
MLGEPPDLVPDDLTAEEYLELGIWYQESNKIAQARESLQRTIKLAGQSNAATRARRLLSENIPFKENDSEVIERFNSVGMTALSSPGRAKKQYESLIEEHPDFEWPYRALAETLCRRIGDLEKAKTLLEEALRINPNYVGALVTMAETLLSNMQYEEARKYLDRVTEMTEDHAEARNLRRTLEILIAGER